MRNEVESRLKLIYVDRNGHWSILCNSHTITHVRKLRVILFGCETYANAAGLESAA